MKRTNLIVDEVLLKAAIAIKHQAPVWHQDRDFDAIAGFSELQVLRAL